MDGRPQASASPIANWDGEDAQLSPAEMLTRRRVAAAAAEGAVGSSDEEEYREVAGVDDGRSPAVETVANPMSQADDSILEAGDGDLSDKEPDSAPQKKRFNGAATEPEPAPSPASLLMQKPKDTGEVGAMMAWMADMIENQHKDIEALRKASARGLGAPSLLGWGQNAEEEAVSPEALPKSREELIEFVHRSPVFASAVGVSQEIKDSFVEQIAGRLERRFYYKDSMIVKKGANATEMYFIYAGMAEVYLDHPDASEESKIPPVARLKKGIFFGEAALLTEDPAQAKRNAWIRANCDMEVYALSSDDLKGALQAHPVMETLFNAEKHKREEQRKAHQERFDNGGGNFRRGFKVRLRTLGTKEKLAGLVTSELTEAFETIPEVFPRSAVEALLLDKVERLEELRDQLAAKGVTEKQHGHGHGKQGPMTEREQRKTVGQMSVLALIFFSLCFVPFVSDQHHAEEMLLATSATHPAMLHLHHFSSRKRLAGTLSARTPLTAVSAPADRMDVALTIEGQPDGLIKSAGEVHGHGRRLQTSCDDSCPTANNGVCEAQRSQAPCAGTRTCTCEAFTDGTDCQSYQPCELSPAPPAPPVAADDGATVTVRAVRVYQGLAERLAEGLTPVENHLMRADHHFYDENGEPLARHERIVDVSDDDPFDHDFPSRNLTLKADLQKYFLSFNMDGGLPPEHDETCTICQKGCVRQREAAGEEATAACMQACEDTSCELVYVMVTTTSRDPIGMEIKVNDLGFTGPWQEGLALLILVCVFAMIVFEVVHHTLAAMIGSYIVLLILAAQHRMPDIAEVVSFMDHGTLALLWGMMIIVGVTAKTGVFEFMAVRLYEVSGGSPFKLLFWLSVLDIVLSAFLDNVTTMLLLAPVSIQLCDAVGRDPRPFLISLALFGNVGGTMTMIGDPPNIIIGNMLKEFVTFNDFIIFLGPGVMISLPTSFWFTKWYFGDQLNEPMNVNLEQLKKENEIRDKKLLIKTGIMLTVVILGFFLHPVIHMDPVWVAVSGAIVIFALDNHHDLEE